MRKKIAVVTVHGYHNYGNRLQNYAVQKIIEQLGFEVETIKTKTSLITKKPTIIQRLLNNKNNLFKKVASRISKMRYEKLSETRYRRFENFTKKNIKETSFYISNNSILNTLADEYTFVVTGSDQVWNPILKGTNIEFLMFVPAEKRVAFSASIGTSFIPEERKEYYSKALNSISNISVRENEAKDIVTNLTGRSDVEVLLDPTMLLTKDQWLEITSDSIMESKQYILVYFLGEQSSNYKRFIRNIATKHNYKIVELLNPKYENYYLTDPAEFVELINNAELICTDSFHGAAFSITLNKQFVVFGRIEHEQPSMNSRITTLLQKFKLENRYWSSDYDMDIVFENIDYEKINLVLKVEKKKALTFLRKAFGI